MSVRVLLITGTVGVGKSTIAAAINDVLAERRIPNAAVDLDSLVWQWPPDSPWNHRLMLDNLAAIWPNFAARGVTHLVLARVLEDRAELDDYRTVIPGAEITVCRLVADEVLRVDRLLARMPPGPSRDWHLARTVELDRALDQVAVADLTVRNDARDIADVALEILAAIGWITS
ncbi:MAG: hypothetical protein QM733_22690 [Ilumatobacteraceae bacterium]